MRKERKYKKQYERNCTVCGILFATGLEKKHICSFTCRMQKMREVGNNFYKEHKKLLTT